MLIIRINFVFNVIMCSQSQTSLQKSSNIMKNQQIENLSAEEDFEQEQQGKPYNYEKFQKANKFPIPSIASDAKYKHILPFSELNFLEYFMIPEKDEFHYVYRPGDDSFFMLNVLKQQLNEWIEKWGEQFSMEKQHKTFSNCIVSQLGSGSGIISAHVCSWLQHMNQLPLLHVSIDINMDASQLSQRYYAHYNLPVHQINTSLFKNTIFSQKQGILQSIKPQIILFNPPYIPVEQQQIDNEQKYLTEKIKQTAKSRKCQRKRQQNMIAFSYMGGTDGLQVTRKLLKSIFWNCWVYLIIMGEEGYQQIQQEISNYKQFWLQHNPKFTIKGKIELMQFMKYQNEDLFLIKVDILSN